MNQISTEIELPNSPKEAEMNVIEFLLHQTSLQVGSRVVQIVEVELYTEPDPYIHGYPEQKMMGRWYFHKMGDPSNDRPTSFKGGTFKGLDLTWGSPEQAVGILIRSILCEDNVIEGPCKVVDFILKETGSQSIPDLLKKSSVYPPSCNDALFPVHLCSRTEDKLPIYAGPRVGLTYHNNSLAKFYLVQPFRFTTSPRNLQKQKFTLVLSFLLSRSPCPSQEDVKLAQEIFGVREPNIVRWWMDCVAGTKCDFDKLDTKTVQGTCQTYGKLIHSQSN